MTKIIECIPNFSEGRDEAVIRGLVTAAQAIPGATLLDYSSDKSHNRSVFTLIGSAEAIAEAAFVLTKKAAETIDLTKHTGEHPRMGATDVIPFVPLKNAVMEDCIRLSRLVAERIARELMIPVFLYEASQPRAYRKNLAHIRQGQLEGMGEKLLDEQWTPDFGESRIHPTAGVVAVGARQPLIAFNANLSTGDLRVANAIAKVIRGSGGGLKSCKAIGIRLNEKTAQVSMNLVNYDETPLYRALELIKIEAKRYGVTVTGTELIGLAPAKAFIDSAAYYLQLEDFDFNRQVIENHLIE